MLKAEWSASTAEGPVTVLWFYNSDTPHLGEGVDVSGPEWAVDLVRASLTEELPVVAPELGLEFFGANTKIWSYVLDAMRRMFLLNRSLFTEEVVYAPVGTRDLWKGDVVDDEVDYNNGED